jgi:hypothetical protein
VRIHASAAVEGQRVQHEPQPACVAPISGRRPAARDPVLARDPGFWVQRPGVRIQVEPCEACQ